MDSKAIAARSSWTMMPCPRCAGWTLDVSNQMNEGARIEAAATGGAILASKDLIERLDATDAKATGIDPHALAYTTISELDGASDKAIRDAGTIAVTRI